MQKQIVQNEEYFPETSAEVAQAIYFKNTFSHEKKEQMFIIIILFWCGNECDNTRGKKEINIR